MISGNNFDRHFVVAELKKGRKRFKKSSKKTLKKLSYITETVIVRELCVILRWLDEQDVGVDLVDGFVVVSGKELFQETLGGNGNLIKTTKS